MRAGKLWTQIEAAFKQADTSGTELECFRSLHKQEQLAASNRIEALREAVNQQKEFERQLQIRYQNLLVEQDNLQRLLQEHKEKMANEKDYRKENAVDTQQSESVVAQVDAHVDVEMLDGSDIAKGKTHDNSSDMQIDCMPPSDGQNPALEGETVEQNPNQTNDAVQLDAQNIVIQDEKNVLQDENIEHFNKQPTDLITQSSGQSSEPGGQVKHSTSLVAQSDEQNDDTHNESVGQVKNQQESTESSVYSQSDINKDAAAVSVEMQYPRQNSTNRQNDAMHNEKVLHVENQQEAQSSICSQNDINKDAAAVSIETQPPMQNSTEGQSDALHIENVLQVENQQDLPQSSIYSQDDINKDATAVSVETQHPIQSSTDGQIDARHNENVLQVENQQEVQSSMYSQNDINEDAGAVSVEMQPPIENSTDGQNDSIHNENVLQVENQQELAPSSIYSQDDANEDAAAVSVDMQHSVQNIDMVSSQGHLKEQLNDSDLLAQNVSSQTQQSVCDETDTVMGVCKVTSQEPVPLCKSDTEGEIVASIPQVDTPVHTEDGNLQS